MPFKSLICVFLSVKQNLAFEHQQKFRDEGHVEDIGSVGICVSVSVRKTSFSHDYNNIYL